MEEQQETQDDRNRRKRREYYYKHREESNARRKKWHQDHREYALQKFRQRHIDHRDEELALNRAWHANNRESNNARRRQYRIDNYEVEMIHNKEWRQKTKLSSPWWKFVNSARERAKKKKVPFELTNAWAKERWTGRCEITGIEFKSSATQGPKFFSASIDRIIPEKGYTEENCRFVLWAVNALKHDGTDEDMIRVALAIVEYASKIKYLAPKMVDP